MPASDHKPLYDHTAERAVLGSILVDPPALHEVADSLRPKHFRSEVNRTVYRAMLALDKGGAAIDWLTVVEASRRMMEKEPADGGWELYISELLNVVPTAVNVTSYARVVHDYAQRRAMLRAGERMGTLAYDLDRSADEALAESVEQALRLQGEHDNGGVLSPREYAGRFIDELQSERDMETLPTPIIGWNRKLLGGLAKPFAHFIAGRPKMGKSSLALQCATHGALDLKRSVYLATTEMSDRQFTRRIVSQQTSIPAGKLKQRNLSPEEMERAMAAAGRLSESRLYLDVSAGLRPSQVRSRCMRLAARKGLDLIIVDHIHEMQPDTSGRPRHLELGDMARSLRETAAALDVPIIVVAQLSRSVESRGVKKPELSDFREAGALEEVAYSVTFVYREHYYKDDADEEAAELIVAAHRDGPTGSVFAKWNGPLMRFENPTTHSDNGTAASAAPGRHKQPEDAPIRF